MDTAVDHHRTASIRIAIPAAWCYFSADGGSSKHRGFGGLLGACVAVMVEFGLETTETNFSDPVGLLDRFAADPQNSPQSWRQDRILRSDERYTALGGIVVAHENQFCWLAILRLRSEKSPEVEFAQEIGRYEGDECVGIEFRTTQHRMGLEEFLLRMLVQEATLARSMRRFRARVVGPTLQEHVLLSPYWIESIGGFPGLLAGEGWIGTGPGSHFELATHADPRAVMPSDAGTDWEEYVGVDCEPPAASWDPWRDEKQTVKGWRKYRWEPFIP